MQYHINHAGVARPCRARRGRCPFGGEDEHYEELAEAYRAYEIAMGSSFMDETPYTSRQAFYADADERDPVGTYKEEFLDYLPRSLAATTAQFGMKPWGRNDFTIPHPLDPFWDGHEELMVRLTDYSVHTDQELVRLGGVRNYLDNPHSAANEFTDEEGVGVRAIQDGYRLYIQEGNHRAAAALVGQHRLRVVLAPVESLLNHQAAN